MWALKSGMIGSTWIRKTLTHFVLAVECGFTPEAVDRMKGVEVDAFLHILSEINKEKGKSGQPSMPRRKLRRLR